MDALTEQAHDALHEVWRGLRNSHADLYAEAEAIIDFALNAGIVTANQHELWRLRIEKCPGHEDEGGRDWCAYGCDMTTLRTEGEGRGMEKP